MALVKLFASGKHKTAHPKKEWSNEDVEAVFSATLRSSGSDIPFVSGHPKNNLPTIGWLKKEGVKLISEGDKKLIVFDEAYADFSSESIEWLRSKRRDKISIRIGTDKAIEHIGFVDEAAVEELNSANFSKEDGVEYAVEDGSHIVGELDNSLIAKIKGAFGMKKLEDIEFSKVNDEKMEELNTLKEQYDALLGQNKQLLKELSTFREATFEKERDEKIESIIKDGEAKGKITDKNKEAVRKIAINLFPPNADFSSGKDALLELVNLIDSMPVVKIEEDVATFESAKKDGSETDNRTAVTNEILSRI